MIRITPALEVPERELHLEFARSRGPGGQNVNKVETAVTIRFDLVASTSLPDPVKDRLRVVAGGRVTRDGIVILQSRRRRTQAQNRKEVMDRFRELLRRAARPPRRRKPTRPTASSREKRLEAKRRKSGVKRLRKTRGEEIE